jgi:hypothetical protein
MDMLGRMIWFPCLKFQQESNILIVWKLKN